MVNPSEAATHPFDGGLAAALPACKGLQVQQDARLGTRSRAQSSRARCNGAWLLLIYFLPRSAPQGTDAQEEASLGDWEESQDNPHAVISQERAEKMFAHAVTVVRCGPARAIAQRVLRMRSSG